MGRLKKLIKRLNRRKSTRLAVQWLPALIIAVTIVWSTHIIVFANQAPTGSELLEYINSGGFLRVGNVAQNGHQQVYYEYEGNIFYITDEKHNHKNINGAGRFMTWERRVNGRSQIVVYDVVVRSSRLVASSGANASPAIDAFGNVAWERWDGQRWQVYYYNYENNQITAVTSGSNDGIRPDVEGANVAFARKESNGTWKTLRFNVETKQTTEVVSGSALEAGWPQFKDVGSGDEMSTNKSSFVRYVEPF